MTIVRFIKLKTSNEIDDRDVFIGYWESAEGDVTQGQSSCRRIVAPQIKVGLKGSNLWVIPV
jgi:hypothetical protein